MSHSKTDKLALKKMRRLLWLMGVVKIPMINFTGPKLLRIDDDSVHVRVKLRRRTKNHLKSMYFGALAVGADVAGGIHAYYFAKKSGVNVSFAFKSMQADFLMRATTDITFISKDGPIVQNVIKEAIEKQERVNKMVTVEAFDTNEEKVAIFKMEISVKVKA
jgi:acyl-coenzyme A thioesterase PaaI-like protein